MLLYFLLAGVASFPALTSANNVMRSFPQRSVCLPEQSCHYYAQSYHFNLCDCPGGRTCPDAPENVIEQDGIRYRFCSPRNPPICRPDQVATTITKILTSIHCVCPEGLALVPAGKPDEDRAEFYCGLPPLCNVGDYCGSMDDDAEYIMEECSCPAGNGCVVDSPFLRLFPRSTASCRPVE